MISRTPVYNLNAVLKETGLKADVLRAWERRYELPKPQRSAGGHRLYSVYDIETIKWLRARQAEGVSISRAVDLWKEIIKNGRDPLHANASPESSAPVSLPVNTQIDNLRRLWLDACLAFDERQAEAVLTQAFSLYPVETVCTSILQQGLSTIGSQWFGGLVSVQQEHFASSQAVRRLDSLISATPAPTREQTLLIGCPPGEWHTFSILLLHLFLRRQGLKVVYLGANVPLDQLEATVTAVQPELVVLVAQQLATAASLQSAARELQAHGQAIAYGGLIFNHLPALRDLIPAYFLGGTVYEAVSTIERLVIDPQPYPNQIHLEEFWQQLSRQYREQRSLIELSMQEALQTIGMHIENGAEVLAFLGNAITAALDLGDLAFLEYDLDWIKRLIEGRKMNTYSLIVYLGLFKRAVQARMGESGAPIVGWIDDFITRHDIAN